MSDGTGGSPERVRPRRAGALSTRSRHRWILALLVGPMVATLAVGPAPSAAVPVAGGATAADTTWSVTPLGEGYPRFVDAVYKDLLNRRSDDAGRAFWVDRLSSGTSRGTYTRQVAGSTEWRTKVVTRLYVEVLDRLPTASEVGARVDQLRAGARVADVAAALWGSPERYTRSGSTGSAWATTLYRSLLGRDPTASERSATVAAAGSVSARTSRARAVFLSLESNGRRVDVLYQLLLQRPSDGAGRAHWAEYLVRQDDIALAAALAGSNEYYARAQKRVVQGSVVMPTTTKIASESQVVGASGGGEGPGSVVLTAATALAVDDILVIQPGADAPYGFLGRVTAVAVGGSTKTATTAPATIRDAFPEVDISGIVEVAFGLPVGGTSAGVSDGTADAPELFFEPGWYKECSADPNVLKITLAGGSPSFDTRFEWGIGKPDVVRFVASHSLTAGISASALKVSGRCEAGYRFTPKFFSLGPLFISVQPSLSVDISGNVAAATLAASMTATCRIGFDYDDGDLESVKGCAVTSKATATAQPPFTSTTAEAKALVHIRSAAYGVAGFSAHAGGRLTYRQLPCGDPWWTVKAEGLVGLDAFYDLGIFGDEITLAETTVGSWDIAESSAPVPCDTLTGQIVGQNQYHRGGPDTNEFQTTLDARTAPGSRATAKGMIRDGGACGPPGRIRVQGTLAPTTHAGLVAYETPDGWQVQLNLGVPLQILEATGCFVGTTPWDYPIGSTGNGYGAALVAALAGHPATAASFSGTTTADIADQSSSPFGTARVRLAYQLTSLPDDDGDGLPNISDPDRLTYNALPAPAPPPCMLPSGCG